MQIPVGLLVDRFGSRSVMLVGTTLLAAAQAGFALAESYPVAVVARIFVGVGDALTFICVLRLVSRWFPARRVPFVTQVTGTLGQLGAVGAAVPMTWALGEWGWTPAYLSAAGLGVVLAVALVVVVDDSPDARHARGPQLSIAAVRASLAASWSHPGTRLGFWMHFTTQFSATALSLLWGFPFLVRGEGAPAHGRAPAHPHDRRGDGERARARLADRAPPVAPLDHRALDRVVDRGRLDRRAGLAGRRRPCGSSSCSSWSPGSAARPR